MGCMLDLPDEVLLYIFSYLSPIDLTRASSVNSRFCGLAKSESIWKYFCREQCLLENKEKGTWLSTYVDYYQRFGQLLISEMELLLTWKKLMSILQMQALTIYNSLQDGLSQQDIADWEKKWQVTLPSSLKFLYLLCGGQPRPTAEQQPGLFGSLCNVDSPSMNTYYFCGPADAEVFVMGDNQHTLRLLTISKDHIGNKYCIVLPATQDVSKDSAGARECPIVWKSADRLFHAADSLVQWIQEYTDRLLSRQYLIENNHILKYLYQPDSVCRTGSITARAGWAAYKFWGKHEIMQFEYRIILEMENDADPKESCQLHTRHWDITHFDDGSKEVIEGPGVVGKHPLMKPGARFSWMSRTVFRKPGGSMGGFFKMHNMTSMTDCVVECPLYTMHFPKEYEHS